jgi:hypothetical protein
VPVAVNQAKVATTLYCTLRGGLQVSRSRWARCVPRANGNTRRVAKDAIVQALQRTSLGWALALALGAWLATASVLYLTVELTRRGIQRRRTGSPR